MPNVSGCPVIPGFTRDAPCYPRFHALDKVSNEVVDDGKKIRP